MMMTPWVQRLLLANILVFLLMLTNLLREQDYALVPLEVVQRPWTLVTYMFLHASFSHLFFNMLGLFFFGPRLEERLGSRLFAWFYFASGIGGALLSFAFTPGARIVGASAAVYGVVIGFARYWPRESIYIWGVLPVQARVLALIMIGSSLFSGITGASNGIAHFAHLGGLAAGWAFLKTWERRRTRAKAPRRPLPRPRPKAAAAEAGALERWRAIPRDGLHEINREELESLIDKAAREGPKSLTNDEFAFLERMSKAAGSAAQ